MTSLGGDGVASDERQTRQDFRPGHAVHWIQAKKSREHLHEAEQGRIASIDWDVLTVVVGGQRLYFQVDDPDWVTEQMAWSGNRVRIQERWSLLRFHNVLVSIRLTTRPPMPGPQGR